MSRCVFSLLSWLAASGFASGTLLVSRRRASARRDRPKALIVDITGPNRTQGEGVRTMGMVVDLQNEACEYDVEVLASCDRCDITEFKWDHHVLNQYLSKVKVWSVSEFKARGAGVLDSYQKIIIGGKLNLLNDASLAAVVGTVLPELLKDPTRYRSKTWGFWDDVPFLRCEYKNLCPKVPKLVSLFAQAAHEFYVLTAGDGERMLQAMSKYKMDEVSMQVWPMRISNMIELMPPVIRFDRQATDYHNKRYLTFLANYHPVNKLNLHTFMANGTVASICEGIRKKKSNVKLLLLGSLSSYANNLFKQSQARQENFMDCVEIREGFVTNEELEQTILPQTRAILNPFFFDVQSGISVKSFEAVKDGMPFITSQFGLHGLSEISDCNFPTPGDGADTSKLADFVLDHLIDVLPYSEFIKQFDFERCIQGQASFYPISNIC